MQIQREPLMQPDPTQPRLVWMMWEQAWKTAVLEDDVYQLALLINTGINTDEKRAAATAAVSEMVEQGKYSPKSVRLLLRNNWEPDDALSQVLITASHGRVQRRLPKAGSQR